MNTSEFFSRFIGNARRKSIYRSFNTNWISEALKTTRKDILSVNNDRNAKHKMILRNEVVPSIKNRSSESIRKACSVAMASIKQRKS